VIFEQVIFRSRRFRLIGIRKKRRGFEPVDGHLRFDIRLGGKPLGLGREFGMRENPNDAAAGVRIHQFGGVRNEPGTCSFDWRVGSRVSAPGRCVRLLPLNPLGRVADGFFQRIPFAVPMKIRRMTRSGAIHGRKPLVGIRCEGNPRYRQKPSKCPALDGVGGG